MIYLVVCITAITASFLTFFSGFGLGTILMPVFALFFNLKTAIALTAIVHLLNNLFKLLLVYKSINYKLVFKFGLPALLASFVGAYLLNQFSPTGMSIVNYEMFGKGFTISWPGLIIGNIILFLLYC